MIHPRLARSVLDRLHSQLIVSVQADDGSPLRDSRIIAALACAAELGGAAGLRVRLGRGRAGRAERECLAPDRPDEDVAR
ncbi:hypothetical protein [Deinococcus sp. LM3]|uniref:hypothetical protein n=1 Tax=Deinococcus sp. LM3 TaxID=1938608 RepID=UPI001F0A881E|nr:hypothetical protein [Deinococcus sp. LM3]